MNKNSDRGLQKNVINWYPGHMAKTKRQIIQDLKLIDIVVEIIDSRIPLASRNPDINEITKGKKRVIVLNKSDLADEEETKKWVSYFEKNNLAAVITDSNSGMGIKNVLKKVEELMKEEMQQNAKKGRVGKAIRIMVLGIPNVGKSSFINRISKKATAQVGNKPGITRKTQWVRVGNNIDLLDTPGVLWPKFENQQVALNLAYTGTIKEEILEKTEVAFGLLKFLLHQYKQKVIDRYGLEKEEIAMILQNNSQDENTNIYEIMKLIGKKRGAIVSGGMINDEKTAAILLEDFQSGKMGRITLETAK